MLELLRIRNLALIADAELDLAPGLNALTGETGAGKSFIMRAVDFILGERMAASLVRPGAEKAVVEAAFDLDGRQTIVRRELSAETGRSRAYIDGDLASQEAVRQLTAGLVLHTSQHTQQRLLSPAFQAQVLDAFVDPGLLALRDKGLTRLKDIAAARRDLVERRRDLEGQREFLEHRLAEIKGTGLSEGEEDALLARKEAAKGLSGVGEAVDRAMDALRGELGIVDRLSGLARDLDRIGAALPEYADQRAFVDEARERLADLAARLRHQEVDAPDEKELNELEARLYAISALKRKLGRTVPGILDLAREIEESLSFLDSSELDLRRLDREAGEAAEVLGRALAALHAARTEAGATLCRRLETELRGLGFSEHLAMDLAFDPTELFPGLTEQRARFLFSPNPGQPPRPLDQIASGGELSRFLLALTSLTPGADRATLIFDEVDAGIGGLTLERVAAKLQSLASDRQLIVITHWPQLAAPARRHFRVVKEVTGGETYTRCLRLSPTDRPEELARMAGGGERGRKLADDLLQPFPAR
jgi:DNA repair protein RecN (Recombination protein N)